MFDMLYDGCFYYLLLLSSFLVWSWGVCIWVTWLNHFWVSISYTWTAFQSLWEDWSVCFVLDDVIVWHILTWPFWSLRSVLWFVIGILYGCSLENHWILWFIIDAFSCWYRTILIFMIVTWCFPVARRELMWLLWIIFMMLSSRLYRAEVILVICDFMSLG